MHSVHVFITDQLACGTPALPAPCLSVLPQQQQWLL